jgi:hypothetical protein
MLSRLLLIGFIAIASWTSNNTAALADWERTRWAMTVDEVKAVVPGIVDVPYEGEREDSEYPVYVLLAAPHVSDNVFYIVTMGFLYGHLNSVGLKPVSIECDELKKRLTEKYGEVPDSKFEKGTAIEWHVDGDRLVLITPFETNDSIKCILYYAKHWG